MTHGMRLPARAPLRSLLRHPGVRPRLPRPGHVAGPVLAIALAACGTGGSTPPSQAPTPSARPTASADVPTPHPTVQPTAQPAPTPVPGGVTPKPVPAETLVTTTQTAWGEILDAVPATFPVLPDAQTTEWPDEAVSGAWLADTGVDAVASWYRDELASQGWGQVELSDPLEDGTRVLDAWADIPECRLQVAFRPAGESTIITVLYGAACAGG